MSDTPRTDGTMKFCFGDDREFVPVDFARQLERELAAANARIHDLHLLARAEELLEKDDRLTRTAAALKPQPEDTADYRGDVKEEP